MTAAQQRVVQQVIVPASEWHDETHRAAILTRIGQAMWVSGQAIRENVDVENATVQPIGFKATVGRQEVSGSEVAFVAYENVDELQHADLVMIVVDAPVVPS